MFFAGIDLGTTFIKDHTGNSYPSGISETVYLSNNVLEIAGKQYAMELFNQKAEYEINLNKRLNKNTKLNFIYALSKLMREQEETFESVMVSLPCSQWKNENTVAEFKEHLNLKTPILIKVNGIELTLKTEMLDILPEGACAYYTKEMNYERFEGRKVLLTDIGGLTINSILFEKDEIIDAHTDELGVLKLYKLMAEKITSETGYNVQLEDMYSILTTGFYIQGNEVPIKEMIQDIALTYCSNIYKHLKLRWSIDTIPFVPLIGAGSITIEEYLKRFIPHVELMPNAQILSAKGMGEMAGVVYE